MLAPGYPCFSSLILLKEVQFINFQEREYIFLRKSRFKLEKLKYFQCIPVLVIFFSTKLSKTTQAHWVDIQTKNCNTMRLAFTPECFITLKVKTKAFGNTISAEHLARISGRKLPESRRGGYIQDRQLRVVLSIMKVVKHFFIPFILD